MNSYYITHLLVFIAGLILFMFPPNKVNSIYGYRTPSSMKNDSTFKFANKYSSKLLMLFTLVSFLICLIADNLLHLKYLNFLILPVFGLTILFTEIKLKKIHNS